MAVFFENCMDHTNNLCVCVYVCVCVREMFGIFSVKPSGKDT
jgi:hypothetical protein